MRFYIIARDGSLIRIPHMDSGTLLNLACQAPITILTKDIAEWVETAQSGDIFVCGATRILALDLDALGWDTLYSSGLHRRPNPLPVAA